MLGAKGFSFIVMKSPAIRSYECSQTSAASLFDLWCQAIAFIPLLSGLFRNGQNALQTEPV